MQKRSLESEESICYSRHYGRDIYDNRPERHISCTCLQVRPEDDRTGDPGRCAVSSGTKDAAGAGNTAVFTETYPMDP